MNVTFKAAQTLGNRPFKAGTQIVPDHLAGNQKFKQLVKSGHVVIHPRDAAGIAMQASKDSMNAKRAEAHRKQGLAMSSARGDGAKPHEVTEVAKPGTAQRITEKRALKAAMTGKPGLPGTPFMRPAPATPPIARAEDVSPAPAAVESEDKSE